MKLQSRLGALAERNFRLVFSSVTISALGDGVADDRARVRSPRDLAQLADVVGLVIAARQVGGRGDHARGGGLGGPAAAPPRARRGRDVQGVGPGGRRGCCS